MKEYFCDLIYDFPWNTFWTALGTIATAVIAWMACKISYQQYQIEKYCVFFRLFLVTKEGFVECA